MTEGEILTFLRDALFTCLKVAAPLLIVSILVGLAVSIFQAATQVNEQTLTFVPKIIAIALVLIALGSWMMSTMVDFFNRTMVSMLTYLQ